jgi:ubiquinone biosynthesis protein
MNLSTLSNMKRIKDIVLILLKYGFSDVAERLDLPGTSSKDLGAPAKKGLASWNRVRHALEDLGPTFVKFGQIMSQRPDLLPGPLVLELAKLQDQVKPEPFEKVKQSLEEALGRELTEVFSRFDEQPLASASLSQVHHAVRLDDGRAVAVKVRRIGIKKTVMSDLDLLAALAQRLHDNMEEMRFYDIPRLVEVTRRTLLRELDFAQEGRNLRIAQANLEPDSKVVVPKVHLDLTNEHMLTMDLVEGRRLAELDGLPAEQSQELARTGLNSIVTQILHDGFFHADPHPGNILVLDQGRICLLDWGMVGRLTAKDRDNLVDFIKAVVDQDVEWLTDSLMGFVEHPPELDRRGLEIDLTDLLQSYYALELSQVNLGRFLSKVTEILRLYGLQVPAAFAVMIKALITAEGTARQIYPKLNVVAEVEPLVREQVYQRLSPRTVWHKFRSFSRLLAELGTEFPKRFLILSEKLEKGELTIGFEHQKLEGLIDSLQEASNRLTLGLIIASMLIASSLIMATGLEPHLFGFPILGVIGYSISGILGVWLIIIIIRSRRF